MKINSRRYIGCKTKLLDFIYDVIVKMGFDKNSVFADIFAGTGAVANFFADKGYKTIVNDNLYSNFVVYKAFLGDGKIDYDKMKYYLELFNNLDSELLEDNYFSLIYGGKYFSNNDAKKIGFIRDSIESNKTDYTQREYYYLITSLMYSSDKIANTVGHYESYLKKRIPIDKDVILSMLTINHNIIPADVYNMDANQLISKIKADIIYIDPPYNARQYVNFYHVLENLARWNKPMDFEGNSMKFKRNELKSGYCRPSASVLMNDLIIKANCKLIVISYSNTYKARSTSSINLIKAEEIKDILEKRGKVSVFEKDYQSFNAGKTNLEDHKELLYVCEVN